MIRRRLAFSWLLRYAENPSPICTYIFGVEVCHATLMLIGLVLAGVLILPALAEKPQRGVSVTSAVGSVPITGDYWALLIGIDKYQHVLCPT